MKELSIEEKAKAYDEALKVANKYKDTNIMFPSIQGEMFPELAEPEDEKIRKYIISHFQEHLNQTKKFIIKDLTPPFSSEEIKMLEASVVWLEKQGEKKQSAWSEEDDQYLLVCKNALRKYQASDKWDAGIISRWLENKLKAPQNRWKPSENELEVLRLAAEKDGVCLMKLYEQLKKLREE